MEIDSWSPCVLWSLWYLWYDCWFPDWIVFWYNCLCNWPQFQSSMVSCWHKCIRGGQFDRVCVLLMYACFSNSLYLSVLSNVTAYLSDVCVSRTLMITWAVKVMLPTWRSCLPFIMTRINSCCRRRLRLREGRPQTSSVLFSTTPLSMCSKNKSQQTDVASLCCYWYFQLVLFPLLLWYSWLDVT